MGRGPLSDKKLVAAVPEVVPLWININDDPKGIAAQHKIRRVPNFVFTRWDGERIELYEGAKEAEPMAARIREIARKYTRDLPWEESLEQALAKAKEGKIVAAVFLEQEPGLVAALLDESLKDFAARLAFFRIPGKRTSEEAKKFKISKSPTVVLLDAAETEIGRIEGRKTARELKAIFEKLLPKEK